MDSPVWKNIAGGLWLTILIFSSLNNTGSIRRPRIADCSRVRKKPAILWVSGRQIQRVQLLTPRCHSLREIEAEINRLHDELELMRKAARTKFKSIQDTARPLYAGLPRL